MRLYFIYLLLFLFRTRFCCMTRTKEIVQNNADLLFKFYHAIRKIYSGEPNVIRKTNTKCSDFFTYVCDSVKNSTVLICLIDSTPIKCFTIHRARVENLIAQNPFCFSVSILQREVIKPTERKSLKALFILACKHTDCKPAKEILSIKNKLSFQTYEKNTTL